MPLFIIYEIGLLLSTSEDLSYLRNGADALMRKMLSIFGIDGLFWISGVFLLGFLIWKFGDPIKIFIDKYFNLLAIIFTSLLIGGFIIINYFID